MKALLDMLPPKERAVFSLAVAEGQALEQVAKRLGLSESTTRRRLAGAKKRFALLGARRPQFLGLFHHAGVLARLEAAASRRAR